MEQTITENPTAGGSPARLSVIIPFYNAAATLRRCVESVLAQGVDGMEVLLIDDGSTDDGALKVADLKGLTLISKENGGLSDARNCGLDHATGDYITFVDADDYLAPYTYRTLMQLVGEHPEYDIMEFSVKRFDALGFLQPSFITRQEVYHSASDYWLRGHAYRHAYAWNKIYKKSIFQDLRYPVGRVFEDVYALPAVIQKAKVIAQVPTGYYCYCFHPESITAHARGKEYRQLLEGYVQAMKLWEDCDFYATALNMQLLCYDLGCRDLLLPRRSYGGSAKLWLVRLFGLRLTCRLHRLAYRLFLRRAYEKRMAKGIR